MSALVEPIRSRSWLRLVASALMAAAAAGCSADVARFSDNPFSNPFASRSARGQAVASAPAAQPAPISRVDAQPLPAPTPVSATGAFGYPQSNHAASSQISSPGVAALTVKGSPHVVQVGETLSSLGRQYGMSAAEIARANRLEPAHRVQVGQQLIIPHGKAAPPQLAARAIDHRSRTAARGTAGQSTTQREPSPPTPQRIASVDPPATARTATPVTERAEEETTETTGSTPSFRWPARGRVIAGFGPKTNGQQNDGINISLPEGTSVKAAEDGVVAYAGNELKGYGNLLLVRHSNGYVTAYAHTSELMVKRGDAVKRGQIIARAGQTGNVNSPQLHFEIRKGKDPVDPMQYLSGG